MAEDYLGFIGTIIGGGISGAVGFFIVWYTNKLQNKERLKDNVYRRLYGYVFALHKQNAPVDYTISTDTWSKVEPYELLKMDQKIITEFDTFAAEIERWNRPWLTLHNNYAKNEDKIKKLLHDAFDQSNLLNTNGNITIKGSNYSVESFLSLYLTVIMNPHIKDSEMLFKTMIEYAQEYYSFRSNEIAYLKENKPLFFDTLLMQLPIISQLCLVDVNYDDMMAERSEIRSHIVKLKIQLEKLAK